MRVPHCDADTMTSFRQWLYIDFKRTAIVLTGQHRILPFTIVKLWIFAEAYKISLLQDMAMELLRRQGRVRFPPTHPSRMSYILKHTKKGSKLRTWYIDQISAKEMCSTTLDPTFQHWDQDAMQELLQSLYRKAKDVPDGSTPYKFRVPDPCAYHVHEENHDLQPGAPTRGTQHAAFATYLRPQENLLESILLPVHPALPVHWRSPGTQEIPLDVFQSISAQSEYCTKSFEELRLEDYELGLNIPRPDGCGSSEDWSHLKPLTECAE